MDECYSFIWEFLTRKKEQVLCNEANRELPKDNMCVCVCKTDSLLE